MLPNLGMGELIVILVIVLLLFGGAKKLPELAKSVGKSLKSFKEGMQDGADSKESDNKTDK